MGVSGGVWECGKPERFSIISMPQSEFISSISLILNYALKIERIR